MTESETLAAMQTLYENVAALRTIKIAEMLDPGRMQFYEKTIQEAYDALVCMEDALSVLGEQIEYEHWRLGGAFEEIQPFVV